MRTEQERALSRTLRRVLKKHRVAGISYIWEPVCGDGKAMIGNSIHFYFHPPTRRLSRRLKGALPELRAALNRTATACGWKDGFNWETVQDVINN